MNITSLIKNAFKTIQLYFPSSYLVRVIFDQDMSTEKAHMNLTRTKIISPTYFTFCPSVIENIKPCIITRSTTESTENTIKNDTYICQTNIDNDNSGDNILWSIERKKQVCDIISKNKFDTVSDLVSSMNVHPIINHETIYVCVMVPQNNKMKIVYEIIEKK